MGSPGANVGDYLLPAGPPDAVAMLDRDGQHTYADLRTATSALVQQITSWGLAPGSRIGLLSRNSLFWAAAYLAILRSGHIAVPFAVTSTPQDVLRRMSIVDAAALLVDSTMTRSMSAAVEGSALATDETAMTTRLQARQGRGGVPPLHPLEAAVPVEPDDDAALMFTSGTTSSPRAVRVTHGNIRANTDSIIDYLGLTSADRTLVVLPFSYCYGASLLHTHLRVGASLSVCDTFAFPETAVEAVRRDGCTGIAGVPSTYQLLLRASSFAREPLPTLRLMQQAGGRLPTPQVEAVASAQPQARLFVMYGATEATSRMSYLPPDLLEERKGSIGRGIPGVTLTVVDETGSEVPVGAVGELFARGENITKGYWNDPEGSAEKFVDGGLRTGDLARADEDGFLYIVDRKADFIKSWGVRVSSREVEDAIMAVPGVSAAAVVGRPDDQAGESIVAFYTTAEGAEVGVDDVLRHCRASLARPLVPHEVRHVQQMPLNPNGKVLKSTLRSMATTEALTRSPSP